MRWLDRMERRFGRLAIRGLMLYIIAANAVVYLFMFIDPAGAIADTLMLRPDLVLRGEIWRLASYILLPPAASPLFIVFILYFYHLVGTGLEHEWGSFRFNLYYLVGIAATTAAAFITGLGTTAVYLNLSLFLAFAQVYPDFELLVFFVLPVKVKYLAWLNWAFLAYAVLTEPLSGKAAALASVVNFFLFFGGDLAGLVRRKRQVYHNRKRFFAELAETPPRHECAICHRTEKSHPRMIFRTCKVCHGDREYCEDHLDKHEHMLQ